MKKRGAMEYECRGCGWRGTMADHEAMLARRIVEGFEGERCNDRPDWYECKWCPANKLPSGERFYNLPVSSFPKITGVDNPVLLTSEMMEQAGDVTRIIAEGKA